MNNLNLCDVYLDYIACLNRQDWLTLNKFVHHTVCYNAKQLGLPRYCSMLQSDSQQIPDLYFYIQLMVCDPSYLASRLYFDCAPK